MKAGKRVNVTRRALGSSLAVLLVTAAVTAAAVVSLLANRIHPGNPRLLLTGDPESVALIVYHPGLGEFPGQVVEGFRRGLQESGWSVVIWTASDSAPTDFTKFDLLVLVSPISGWRPSRPVRRYLERVGDLRGTQVAVLVTGIGLGKRAAASMERMV